MSTENDTPQGGGGAAAPAAEVVTTPAPRNDAEAAQQAQATPPEPSAEEKAAAEKARKDAEDGERRKNRTRDYINRINGENRELRERLAALEAGQRQPTQAPVTRQHAQPASDEPTLEQYAFDVEAFTRAHNRWAIEQDRKSMEERSRQEASTQKQREILTGYEQRVAAFADQHPDFQVVVGSMQYPLSMDVQLAIMAHERGPEIAYHLANHDDDAFSMASIQPHLAAAAVERLASRITAAPKEVPITPAVPAQAQPRPISQAPAPTPTVSGRAPTETPPEKLTDDQWYAKDRERRRKR